MRKVWRLAPLLPLLAALGAASAHAQATAPGGPDPMVCVYNTTLPTLAAGGSGFVQCDSNGRIIISNPGSGGGGGGGSVTQGTTPWIDNIAQWAGTTLGAPSNFGTSPGAVPVPGVNAFVTNFPATQAVSWSGQTVAATQSGAWSVSISNFPTTQAVNNTQVNGVAIATGTGASNTGTQRTVLSTDSTVTLSGTLPAFATTPTFNIGTAPTLTVQGTLTGNQGTPAAIANAWPTYLSQAGAALSSTNGLPTTDTNAAQSFTAPGTGAAKVQGIQGVAGGIAVPVSGTFFQATQPVSGTVTSNQGTAATIANAWPTYLSQGGAALSSTNPLFTQLTAGSAKIGITTTDQTTHGTTDKVAADLYVSGAANTSANPIFVQTTSTGAGTYIGQVQQNSPTTLPFTTAEQGSSAATVGITSNAGTGSTCSTAAATTGCVAKNAQGNLYRGYSTATTAPAAQQYLVCINAAAVPTSGAAITAVDFAPFNLATTAGSTASINFGPGPPSAYATGITCLISTSLTTYTAGTAAFVNTSVR